MVCSFRQQTVVKPGTNCPHRSHASGGGGVVLGGGGGAKPCLVARLGCEAIQLAFHIGGEREAPLQRAWARKGERQLLVCWWLGGGGAQLAQAKDARLLGLTCVQQSRAHVGGPCHDGAQACGLKLRCGGGGAAVGGANDFIRRDGCRAGGARGRCGAGSLIGPVRMVHP